jgi:hypothetical protein
MSDASSTLIKDKRTGKVRAKTAEGKTKTLSRKAVTKPEAKRVQSPLAEIEEAAKAGTLTATGTFQLDTAISLGGIQRRSLRHFRVQVEDWYDACRELTLWEDQNLIDEATSEKLAEHERILNELDRVGRWLSKTAQEPDFPDTETVKLVGWALQDIRDRRVLWHGPLDRKQRSEIVASIFDES